MQPPIEKLAVSSPRRSPVVGWLAWLLAGVALVAAPGVAAPAPPDAGSGPGREWRVTPDLVVREIEPGVWLHRSWNDDPAGERTASNGLVVREDGGLAIVDTPWGNEPTAALLDWIARELKEPVRRVIVTHAHDDRMAGARVVRERAIPLLASPRTVELAAARSREHLPMALAGLDEGKAVPVGALEVFNPGPAHAPDNVVVWLPEQRLLFGGCAVKSADATSLGFTGDANLARWPDAIRRVKQRYPAIALVVPGHGEPGGQALLDRTTRLLVARRPVPRRTPTARPVARTPEPSAIPTVEPQPATGESVLTVPAETSDAPATPAPRIVLPAEEPR